MTRIRKTVNKKEQQIIDIDISDRDKYPDGQYEILASFDENNYYNGVEGFSVIGKDNNGNNLRENFETTQMKIKISKDGINWITPTTIEGKYYDDSLLYIRIENSSTGETLKGNYDIDISYNNIQITNTGSIYYTIKQLTNNENNVNVKYNAYVINNLPSLNVGNYTINITFTPTENIRMLGETKTFTYKQNKNTLGIYFKNSSTNAYSETTNQQLNKYIDDSDLIQCQFRTIDGDNPIPNNIEVNLMEGNNVINTTKTYSDTSINNNVYSNDGCVSFNNDFKSGSYSTITNSKTLSALADNKEYVIDMDTNSYTLTFGLWKIIFTNNTQSIYYNNNLFITENYSIPSIHELFITKHNNIFRIMVRNQIIFSINKNYITSGFTLTVTPILIRLYTLNNTSYIYNTTYNFNVNNNNFTNNSNVSITYTKNELEYEEGTYRVDDEHLDKVVNYYSRISWQSNNKSGFLIGTTSLSGNYFDIKDYFTAINSNVEAKIYNIKKHYCMQFIEFSRTVYPLDWKISTTNVKTEPNINLMLYKNSSEIEDEILPTDKFKILVNTGIRNKQVKIYKSNNNNSSYGSSAYKNGTTGENGKLIIDNLSLDTGTYYFKATSDYIDVLTNNTKSSSSDANGVKLVVFNPTTTMTLSANKSSFTVNDSIRLTATIKREGNNITDSEFGKQTVKFYAGSNLLGTAQTTNGVAIFDYDLINFISNGYSIGNVSFKAVFEGGEILGESQNTTNVTINKLTITPTISFTNSSVTGTTVKANYSYSNTSSNTLTVNIANLNELVNGNILLNNVSVKSFSNTISTSYTIDDYTDLANRKIKVNINGTNYINSFSKEYTITYNNVITTTTLTIQNSSPKWGVTNKLTATVKDTNGNGISGRTVTFKEGTTTIGSGKTNANGIIEKTITMPSTVGTFSYSASIQNDGVYKASNNSLNTSTLKRDVILSLVQPTVIRLAGTIGINNVENNIWYYGWSRKYRVVDEFGERVSGLSGNIDFSVDGNINNGATYNRTTNASGEMDLLIRQSYTENAKLYKYYTKAKVNGNNLYNGASTNYIQFNYKWNDAIFSHPQNISQNGDGVSWYNLNGDISWKDNNMENDYLQCGQCNNSQIAPNNKPKSLICTNYTFNNYDSSFIFESNIQSKEAYIYDKNHACVSNQYPVIGTPTLTFKANGLNKSFSGGMVQNPNELPNFKYNTIVNLDGIEQTNFLDNTFKLELYNNINTSQYSGLYLIGGLFILVQYRPNQYYL